MSRTPEFRAVPNRRHAGDGLAVQVAERPYSERLALIGLTHGAVVAAGQMTSIYRNATLLAQRLVFLLRLVGTSLPDRRHWFATCS